MTPWLPTRKARAIDEPKSCAALSNLFDSFTGLLVLVWLFVLLRFPLRSFQVQGRLFP